MSEEINPLMITNHDLTTSPSTSSVSDTILPDLWNNISTSPSSGIINNKNDTIQVSDMELLLKKLYLYSIPPLLLFCLATVVVNTIIVISVRWIRRPLSPTLSFSVSLAAADAYASLVVGIGLIINSLLPIGFDISLGANDICYTLTLEAFRLGGIIVTVAHLTALAINHYIGILRPLHYASTMTPRTTLICIAFLWIVPISGFFIYFSVIKEQAFRSEYCKNIEFLLHKKFRIMFSILFFGPLLLMGIIYVHIFIIVRRHQASRLRFQNSQQLARNLKAIKTTVLILGTCIIGWIPAVLLYTLRCKDCLYTFDTTNRISLFILYTSFNFLYILKTFVDPIIYSARMHEIKMALKRMKMFCCKCCPASIIGNDNSNMRVNSELSQHRLSLYISRHNRRHSGGIGVINDNTSVCRFQSVRNGSMRSNNVLVTIPIANNNTFHHRPSSVNTNVWNNRRDKMDLNNDDDDDFNIQNTSTLI